MRRAGALPSHLRLETSMCPHLPLVLRATAFRRIPGIPAGRKADLFLTYCTNTILTRKQLPGPQPAPRARQGAPAGGRQGLPTEDQLRSRFEQYRGQPPPAARYPGRRRRARRPRQLPLAQKRADRNDELAVRLIGDDDHADELMVEEKRSGLGTVARTVIGLAAAPWALEHEISTRRPQDTRAQAPTRPLIEASHTAMS